MCINCEDCFDKIDKLFSMETRKKRNVRRSEELCRTSHVLHFVSLRNQMAKEWHEATPNFLEV